MAEDKRETGSDSSLQYSSADSIPVIDLRLLTLPDDGRNQVEFAKLRAALGSWGLFQLAGHGIPTSFLDEVRNIGRQFFELPMEEKQRYSCKGGEGFVEGYGVDHIVGVVSRSDRVLLWVEPQDQRKLEFWPDNPSSFRETVHEYSARVKTVVQLVLQALAKSLNLEETHFIGQSGERMGAVCRFCHYPPCSEPDLSLGQIPHSDNSVLTVILQGDVEGLELLKDGVWVKVPNNTDVLLIVMGDLMEIMSNGTFKSPVHRVVVHSERERTSTVLFYAADPEKEIGPPEKLLKEGKPRLYRDVKVQDYLDAHLKGLSGGKRSIDWAKV